MQYIISAQPFASALCGRRLVFENRAWSVPIPAGGQWIAVVSKRSKSEMGNSDIRIMSANWPEYQRLELPLGMYLFSCYFVDLWIDCDI